MPPGWFSAPARAWWPDFKSDLCTAGNPLCILTASAIYADKRSESLERLTARAYHFRRVDGRIGASERVWTHLNTKGGSLPEQDAAKLAGVTVAQLYAMVHAALSSRVLVRVRKAGGNQFELGPVRPAGVAP